MSARLSVLYAVLVGLLGVGIFVRPGSGAVVWSAIGFVTVAAILVGVRLYRPARVPWLLLAGAVAAMASGDAVFALSRGQSGALPWPTVSDVCYLAMFPLLAAGMIGLTRSSVVLRDRARLLDLLTLACGAALAVWVWFGGAAWGSPALDGEVRVTLFLYTLGDLLVLLTTARLVVAARRSPAVVLLAVGAVGALVGDVGYGVALGGDGWRAGSPPEFGYLLFYAAWGLAALQPSMAQLTTPRVPVDEVPPARRPVLVSAVALAVPAVVLLVESLAVWNRDGVLIALVSALLVVLVSTRLADAVAGFRHALARERSLRRACAGLVAAAEVADVDAGVRRAVGEIVPAGVGYDVVFVVEGASCPVPEAGPQRRARVVAVRGLDEGLQAALGGRPAALVCPLVLGSGAAPSGALLVAADERVLPALRDAVEVLMAQAGLAMERIALTAAVTRRDRDEYLRTVAAQTTDVVLIVDGDQRVRYASPSLTRSLGAELPLFATVRDLVAAEDRGQVVALFGRAGVATDPAGVGDVWRVVRPDASRVLVDVRVRDLRQDAMVAGFVVTMREVPSRAGAAVSAQELGQTAAGRNRRRSTERFR